MRGSVNLALQRWHNELWMEGRYDIAYRINLVFGGVVGYKAYLASLLFAELDCNRKLNDQLNFCDDINPVIDAINLTESRISNVLKEVKTLGSHRRNKKA